MRKLVFLLAGVLLSGCQTMPPADVAKYPISEEAKQALAQAEADVKEAQAHADLWTTAQTALKNAEKAASQGDSGTVVKLSKQASELARLGIEQTRYPLVH